MLNPIREDVRRPPLTWWRALLPWMVLGVLLVLTMDFFVRQMLYPAPAVRVPSPPAGLEEVSLAFDGEARAIAWARTAPRADAPAVVFFHGNGENLETLRWSGLYDELSRLNLHFLAVDFPGYGRSDGRPSQESLVAAALASCAWMENRHPSSPLAVLGWSLGAAVAAQAAAELGERVDRVALLSPWDDLPTLASTMFPSFLVGMALRDDYDSRAAAARITAPALLIHGTRDAIIPIEHGRRLRDAFGQQVRWVEVEAGHNDLLGQPRVWAELAAFLAGSSP